MGKQILIVALGMTVIISFLVIQLNANTTKAEDATVGFYEQQQSRVIANSGVEIYLEKMRRNKKLKGNFFNNSLFTGSYDIYIYGPDTAMKIKSVGRYLNAVHTTLVHAKREPVVMPDINASLYISAATLSLNLNGNLDIDGHDHDISGLPGSHPAVPGIGVDTPADSEFVINNVKPKISGSIDGLGGPPSIRTVSDFQDWMSITQDIIFSADTVLATGTYSNGATFGTVDKPIITYCDGDVDFTDATGAGIMVVNGNINLSGNFRFNGILIVYGQSSIRTQTIGNNAIYGATILVGESVSIQSQGNSLFYYSYEAINKAQLNLKSSRFEILSWWE